MHYLQELTVRLLALDQLLGSVALQEQKDLDLEAVLSKDCGAPNSQEAAAWCSEELYYVVDTVPRFDLIPATLVDICRTSWQGRVYENVYRRPDAKASRNPTCSEVIQLLPKLDRVLKTGLNNKIIAIVALGRCGRFCATSYIFELTALVPAFRFLDLPTEVRLQVYADLLPRQPYFILKDVKPRRHAEPCYDLAALRTCWRIHNELINEFYKDETLVMNVYNFFRWHGLAVRNTIPRERLLVLGMRKETRLCFKRLEIRFLDTKEPHADRPGLYWEAIHHDEGWVNGTVDTYFREVLDSFPNIKQATVSFEIEETQLRYWFGIRRALPAIAEYLISEIPERIKLRWDFQPTSHPDLQDLRVDEEDIMDDIKATVNKETAKRGRVVELGKGIIKEYIVSVPNGPYY